MFETEMFKDLCEMAYWARICPERPEYLERAYEIGHMLGINEIGVQELVRATKFSPRSIKPPGLVRQ